MTSEWKCHAWPLDVLSKACNTNKVSKLMTLLLLIRGFEPWITKLVCTQKGLIHLVTLFNCKLQLFKKLTKMVRPQKSKCIRLFLVIVSLICHILGWFDFFRPSCRLDIRYKIGHWSELVTKRFRVRILGKKSIIFQGLNKL